jgi:hypothetical protein
MNNYLLRAACAAVALSVVGTANAIPVIFEFSGTVNSVTVGSESWMGQQATGRFEIETDNFVLFPAPPTPPTYSWTDALPFDNRPTPLSASLAIGADAINLNAQADIYGGIHLSDGCAPDCPDNLGDYWSISAYTQSFALGSPVPDGGYTVSSLSFWSWSGFGAPVDLFDASTLSPVDILTLPLLQLSGSYHAWSYNCMAGECEQTGATMAQFAVDSVVRTAEDTMSVPEPGTLGMLATALAGLFLLRRRQPVRPAA